MNAEGQATETTALLTMRGGGGVGGGADGGAGGGAGGDGRLLSEPRDSHHRISKDGAEKAPIRYVSMRASRQSADEREPKTAAAMGNWRSLSFLVGVIYSVVALGVAAATLGYRFDVENDGYGFRALMEGTALLSTVTFIASLGLVYGVIESRSGFVSAWLVLQVVVPLYTAAFYIWAIFASGHKTVFGPVSTAVPVSAIVAAVHIISMIGCTIIVNNYYTYLKIRETLKKSEDIIE